MEYKPQVAGGIELISGTPTEWLVRMPLIAIGDEIIIDFHLEAVDRAVKYHLDDPVRKWLDCHIIYGEESEYLYWKSSGEGTGDTHRSKTFHFPRAVLGGQTLVVYTDMIFNGTQHASMPLIFVDLDGKNSQS